MWEVKAVGAVSVICSLSAIFSCFFVLTGLHDEMRLMEEEVNESVKVFQFETEPAWHDMMDVQSALSTPAPDSGTGSKSSKNIQNPFESHLKRIKKRQTYSGLPSWCQCEPAKPICPPGPPGPQGAPGPPGQPGPRGYPGEDNHHTYEPIRCEQPEQGCIRCYPGPEGPPGREGPAGPPGPDGKPGLPGFRGLDGKPGKQGEAGNEGLPGRPGSDGRPGLPGKDGKKSIGLPGRPGGTGFPGKQGLEGLNGKPGRDGLPGPMGPPGKPGYAGTPGKDGEPGIGGNPGVPGPDAGYCKCPNRNSVYRPPTVYHPVQQQPDPRYDPRYSPYGTRKSRKYT